MPKKQGDGLPWPIPNEAMRYAGYRAMRGLAAERPEEAVGFGALGMYLFSHALWLADEMRRGGFDRLVFIARDGWLVRAAFDRVNAVLRIPVETDYVRISRRAAFPLHFGTAQELSGMEQWVDCSAHTTESMMALLAPVLDPDRAKDCLERGILHADARLDGAEKEAFLQACRDGLWSQEKAAAYRAYASAYFAPKFVGRCATFDVGYNLRSESVIRALTGAEITAFITHTDSDVPDRRGVPYRTLYGQSPYVSWVAREQFLLEDAPQCVGYDGEGPVPARAEQPCEAVKRCQRQALAFVDAMVARYGASLRDMPFRPADGCAAFEHFLHFASRREMLPYRMEVENAFHSGSQGEDSAFLQWRLMQTDARAALGEPRWLNRLRRAVIRLREEPGSVMGTLQRRLAKSRERVYKM